MTIDEAIKLNEELRQGLDMPLMAKYDEALGLGNEAMREVERFRKDPDHYKLELLPGETEEVK